MGEGGRVEIAKLWEPQQYAEDEGRVGGKRGAGRELEAKRHRNAMNYEVSLALNSAK